MLEVKKINLLSETFKIFSDPTRLKILIELLNEEINVNSLCKKLNMSQSSISHQLKLLRANNIVVATRNWAIDKNIKLTNNKIRRILESNIKILSEVVKNETNFINVL
jgi:DNA-binding transcriptional ArsR family regulator